MRAGLPELVQHRHEQQQEVKQLHVQLTVLVTELESLRNGTALAPLAPQSRRVSALQ